MSSKATPSQVIQLNSPMNWWDILDEDVNRVQGTGARSHFISY